jgi:hypothetical protein
MCFLFAICVFLMCTALWLAYPCCAITLTKNYYYYPYHHHRSRRSCVFVAVKPSYQVQLLRSRWLANWDLSAVHSLVITTSYEIGTHVCVRVMSHAYCRRIIKLHTSDRLHAGASVLFYILQRKERHNKICIPRLTGAEAQLAPWVAVNLQAAALCVSTTSQGPTYTTQCLQHKLTLNSRRFGILLWVTTRPGVSREHNAFIFFSSYKHAGARFVRNVGVLN